MYDSVIISDTHLGSKFSNSDLLKLFLDSIRGKVKTLYLAGDIFDLWKVDPGKLVEHQQMFHGFNVVYVYGNHDSELSIASIFSDNVFRSVSINVNERKILITHGDIFDRTFGKDSFINIVLDRMIHSISVFLRLDIRGKIRSLSDFFYSRKLTKFHQEFEKITNKAYFAVVYGHTHYEGVTTTKSGLRCFNLGSWYCNPHVFFIKGNSYAFMKISEDKLEPLEKDFAPCL